MNLINPNMSKDTINEIEYGYKNNIIYNYEMSEVNFSKQDKIQDKN